MLLTRSISSNIAVNDAPYRTGEENDSDFYYNDDDRAVLYGRFGLGGMARGARLGGLSEDVPAPANTKSALQSIFDTASSFIKDVSGAAQGAMTASKSVQTTVRDYQKLFGNRTAANAQPVSLPMVYVPPSTTLGLSTTTWMILGGVVLIGGVAWAVSGRKKH